MIEEQGLDERSDFLGPRLVLFPKTDGQVSDYSEYICTRRDSICVLLTRLLSDNEKARQALIPILSEFKKATDDLNALIRHVGSFVDWWGDMNMSLANIEEILPQIKADRTNPFRTETTKERWKRVHDEYVWYQREVSRFVARLRYCSDIILHNR